MLIPVGTDAPIYHLPVGTVLLAVANVGVHIYLGQTDPDGMFGLGGTKQEWSLWLGEGLHPLQWVTSQFLHTGWVHLVGNVIFLWGFGIVAEGKLGWWRFLPLYLAIGAAAAGLVQLALLPGWLTEPPRAVQAELLREAGEDEDTIEAVLFDRPEHVVATAGAGAAIFGLVALSMVWAPRNDLSVVWLIAYRGGISDLSILTFALLYIGLEVFGLAALLTLLGPEYALSAAVPHVVGAALGAVAGVLLLKLDWVDCENWDLFAVWKGTHGSRDAIEMHRTYHAEITVPTQSAGGGDGPDGVRSGDDPAGPARRPRGAEPARRKKPRKADPLARMRRHLAGGDGISALGEWETVHAARPAFVPPEPDLFALAEAVDKENFADEAAGLFALYLRSYPKPKAPAGPDGDGPAYDAARNGVIRLRAARRLLERPGGRSDAAAVLRGVDPSALAGRQRAMFDKLLARAAG